MHIALGTETELLDAPCCCPPQVTEWTDKLTESCVNQLKKLGPGLKLCVSAVLGQRTEGGGLHAEWAFRYDPKTDGACAVTWQNETIVCHLTIIGLAI